MPNILIVGASRGLGLGLAEGFAGNGWSAIGTVRGDTRTELHDLAGRSHRVRVETLDMTKPDQIEALRERLSETALDILFVNAGTAVDPALHADTVATEDFEQVMATNVLGPMRVIEMLKDRVAPGGLIGAMTSGQGSIANATNGKNDIYRASKAALNMLMQCFAVREAEANPKRALLLLAPGWVRTDLGGDKAPYTIEDTIPLLTELMIAKQTRPGLEYLDRFGETVPW